MVQKIRVHLVRCLLGASAGLTQKTAFVRLQIEGGSHDWSAKAGLSYSDLAAVLPTESLSFSEFKSSADVMSWLATYLVDPTVGDLFARAVVALAVAIQREARDPVWRGRVVRQDGEMLELALPYEREPVLKAALSWALRYWSLWGISGDQQQRAKDLARGYALWLQQAQGGGLSPNSLRFALSAHMRGIPVRVEDGLLWLGWGSGTQRLDSSFTGNTSQIAARIARDKHLTSLLLHQAALPVPATGKVSSWEGALALAQRLVWPVVVKPGNQDQGKAVTPGIRDEAALRVAYDAAAKYSPGGVIVEKHVKGEDHRLLVVGGQLLMATRRIPGAVIGDGRRSVVELMAQVNADPRRGVGQRSLMIRLALDEEAKSCLIEQDLTPDSVPGAGRFVHLRRTANISTGGTALDVSSSIHPENRLLAERAARIIGLDIAGVDFLCPDITQSWRQVGGAICEVNAQPGFRPHWLGDPERDINGEILDRIFKHEPARIPTAAITGTNGKSTTARMLHHIWMAAGKLAGVCTTQGVWVGHDLVTHENMSGFPGARVLLGDPTVEAAVLEMPRKGLIRFGHPCDRYDVAALLNVQDDHIGVDGVASLEEMARLKAQVLERAKHAIVLNADDALSLAGRRYSRAKRHVLVSTRPDHPVLIAHRNNSGPEGNACVFCRQQDGEPWIVLAQGEEESLLMPLHAIPATMNGLLRFNEINALFAAALAWVQGIEPAVIERALATFHNSPEQNPGRYNFIEGLPFQVLVDYGHNPDGMRGLMDVVKRIEVPGQRVLVNCHGLRFRHHLAQELPWYAQNFDRIYLGRYEGYFRRFSRGFDAEDPVSDFFRQAQALLQPLLQAEQSLQIVRHHMEALREGLESCKPGDLLVLLADPADAMAVLQAYRGRQAILAD